MIIRPSVCVGKRIPCQMRCDAEQHRYQNHCEAPEAEKSKVLLAGSDPLLKRNRQELHEWISHPVVEEPERCQTEGERHKKRAGQRVTEASTGTKSQKIIKIGRKRPHKQGRGDQGRTAEWKRCGSVSESEGHISIIAMQFGVGRLATNLASKT